MRVRRAPLSTPGHSERMIEKASKSSADQVILDLEDSVAPDKKDEARSIVIRGIDELDWSGKTVSIRMNAVTAQWAYKDVIEIVSKVGEKLGSIVIPKVESENDIAFVDLLLNQLQIEYNMKNRIALEAQIESHRGMVNLVSITKSSKRLEAILFGSGDYSASVGARNMDGGKGQLQYPGHRWHSVLSRMIDAAKAESLQVIDAPYPAFKDTDGFIREAEYAAALGCDGKWAIHPDQIELGNKIFSPMPEEIEKARKILQAMKESEEKGLGVALVDGEMVDIATIKLAENTMMKAQMAKMI